LTYEIIGGQPPFVDDDPMGVYQKILNPTLSFPRYFDRNAKNLVKKLLVADLTRRYGCLKSEADDIKRHKWFQGIDWALLVERRLTAPFIPRVLGPTDTLNFDPYPDSLGEPPMPVYNGEDPFLQF